MSLLEFDLQQSIYEGFQGRLLSGVLRRTVSGESSGKDDKGDPFDIGYDPDIQIEGFNDQFTAFIRMQPGFPQEDVKVCIFGGSAPDLTPKANDAVGWDMAAGRRWFRLREGAGAIRVDPASALWECQAYPCAEPL